jgi:hypothetical protein
MRSHTCWKVTSISIAALITVLTATPAMATPNTAPAQRSSWAAGRINSAQAVSTYPASPASGDGFDRTQAPTPVTGDDHSDLKPNPAIGDAH